MPSEVCVGKGETCRERQRRERESVEKEEEGREEAGEEKKEMGQKGGGRRAGESKLSGLPLLLGAISHLDSSILRLIVRKKNTEKITSCHGNG